MKECGTHQVSISRRRAIVYSLIVTVGLFVALELAVRVGAFFVYGFSPYYLLYGLTSSGAADEGRSAAFDGYFKFPPSRMLRQYGMFVEPTPIRINSLGFRGRDFEPQKRPGTYRIVCIGESSTFGFFSRDDYTYPAALGRLFADRLPDRTVEVINAGVPQANSDNMTAMIEREILGYRPDLITLYAGYNDAVYVLDETRMQRLARWVHGRVATYVALKAFIATLGGPVLHSKWATYIPKAGRDYIDKQVKLHIERYVANLERIGALTRNADTRLLLITQPMTTSWGKDARVKQTSYAKELTWITEQLDHEGWVTAHEGAFLVHRALMQSLEATARRERRSLVDNIAIVNERPDYLASYVHLTEEGNQALAEALYHTISPWVAGKVAVDRFGRP